MTGLRRARLPTWPTIAVASLVAPLLACTCVCVWVPPQMQCAGSALAILTSQLAALRSLTTQRWDKGPIPVPARRRGTFAGPVVRPTAPPVAAEAVPLRGGHEAVTPPHAGTPVLNPGSSLGSRHSLYLSTHCVTHRGPTEDPEVCDSERARATARGHDTTRLSPPHAVFAGLT